MVFVPEDTFAGDSAFGREVAGTAKVGGATVWIGAACVMAGDDLNIFWSGSRFTLSLSSFVSIFTSFNPDFEIKSIKSLISDVFIEAWLGSAALGEDCSFFAAGFEDR